ncbi:MAG: 3-deoxy-7-phosphoheptulonate synthase, partial [Silvibacterium sp.]
AVAVGADGLIVEVHHAPDRALSDGAQSIYPEQFVELMQQATQIAALLGRNVPHGIEISQEAGAIHVAR